MTTDSSSQRIRPTDLKLKRAEQELHVTWADGTRAVLSAATLRRSCPCAVCREQHKDRNPLRVLNVTADQPITMTGARLMGNYALQLVWSDGHDSGIFDFEYLHRLASAE